MKVQTKQVRVAVGVVLNAANEVLIAQRQSGQHLAGLWEFPGGKIEMGESCAQALVRELWEEVGIKVASSDPFMVVAHQYETKSVELDVHMVRVFSGEAFGREGQSIRWEGVSCLIEGHFPEANRPIIAALKQFCI
ncbi:8-oxo-dGTP diphosphatase MutT [Teredinibacter purpureus]|jgi:8-oxo-dGTPase (EC 3.6.1.-)|uniref:8-oxo-dGTP diphosphatase MutT n=1 Tax=Teredinibacter purpureus TaxID=2731756 RepID=UPI0005F7B333|nr:8-oxo-dGTP diphosphatase MutT [Teredinibacter purpureus]